MRIRSLHPWDLSARDAMAVQRELAARVVRRGAPAPGDVRLIAGSDAAFDRPNARGVGAVVVLAYPSLEVVERVTVEAPVTFPYVPGLLSFREAPVLIQAFQRLRNVPDLLIVDGHGYAHPRRFGFACHLGLLLDLPTIGVAKSRLVGEAGAMPASPGSRADLMDSGEVIGSLLRTRDGVRPLYVSVGHRIGLTAAERWVLACVTKYRLPEPTRLADRLAGEAKRRMLDATIEMVVEQRTGERGRWEWEHDAQEVVFRHDMEPMPVHYGCSTEIINSADGELLDVMLLDDAPRERAEHLAVRVVDVLERSDGDHKLLAVPADGRLPAAKQLERARREIWRWYTARRKPITRWGGEAAAIALIRAFREGHGPPPQRPL